MRERVRIFNRLALGIAMATVAFALAGCISASSLDQLAGATPSGSPFQQSLFKNYAYLAHSFGSAPSSTDSGFGDMFFGSGDDTGTLAEAFATKALIAAK